MKKFLSTLILGTASFVTYQAYAAEVTILCSNSGIEMEICKNAIERWTKDTGNTAKIVPAPTSWDDMLPLYQQSFAAKSKDLDVFPLDVIWAGSLGEHLLDLTPYINKEVIDAHFPTLIKTVNIGGKLIAMPSYADTGFLFYRKDLLDAYGLTVPQTWQELTKAAQIVQKGEREKGNSDFWGYVWQGRAYEGLTCNISEWFGSANGSIVSPTGEITVNSEQNVKMLELASSWVGDISPKGVLNYDEESSRAVFQSGNALFHRNWSYVWALANDKESVISAKIGVTTLPQFGENGQHIGVNGAAYMAVSKYTDTPEASVSLMQYMTDEASQKITSIQGGYNPTIAKLYKDEEVLKASPYLARFTDNLSNMISRPSDGVGNNYARISKIVREAVHNSLSGKEDAQKALDKAQKQLEATKERSKDWN
ncbi:MAG: ABC transporter substrate-binding protein [Alphaproteobacteria bacterium]